MKLDEKVLKQGIFLQILRILDFLNSSIFLKWFSLIQNVS
jgi:hypothetical protein